MGDPQPADMKLPEIDLEGLARGYRFRPISERAAKRAADAARRSLDPLLDVGGGTGAHAEIWSQGGRTAVVLDLSTEMTVQAARRRNLHVARADAEQMPFVDDSFGLAYFHTSVHYGNWRSTLGEAVRVVRKGGFVEVWTFAPHSIGSSSLGRWFPSIVTIDSGRFPEPKAMAEYLGSLCSNVLVVTETEPIARTAREWIDGVQGGFVSTLQLLDQAELDVGIDTFRSQYPNDSDIYRYSANYTSIRCVV
jgi:ubiquinone/menaquinone biosynthesis C-methylase UbiE